MAEDFDGPSYDHVQYSIVDGNQGSPFTIDPLRGELKVARQLDRERVRETVLTVHMQRKEQIAFCAPNQSCRI